MKTAELEGVDLDRWVALAQGYRIAEHRNGALEVVSQDGRARFGYMSGGHPRYSPSTDAELGLFIVERARLWLTCADIEDGGEWIASFPPHTESGPPDGPPDVTRVFEGPTPLIAAMRAFVASVYGDEVQG